MKMTHDRLYVKYEDSIGDTHLQSVSDLIQVGPLIEIGGSRDGDEMELADDQFYSHEGFPIESINFED